MNRTTPKRITPFSLLLPLLVWALVAPQGALAFTPDLDYLQDRQLIEDLQRSALRFAWDLAELQSGMTYETSEIWPDMRPAAVGATGFGVAAIVVGVDRGWIPRDQALERLLKLTLFLRDRTERKNLHGAFPHWIDGITGRSLPFSKTLGTSADIVETAYLMAGLLTARSYFTGPGDEARLREIITELWLDVEWDWFTNGEEKGLYWHWDPQRGFSSSLKILGFNECHIAYLLALSSPSHPISRQAYDYWTSGHGYQPKTAEGYRIQASLDDSGPLFLAQYSYIFLNPRDIADSFVTWGYYVRNVTHALINRSYCLYSAPREHGYSAQLWGLTASLVPDGYNANSPRNDSGVIAPTAALSSLPYLPAYAMEVLRYLGGPLRGQIWGECGPYDAFRPSDGWTSSGLWLGIDQLPMVTMAENYRSGLIWDLFMAIPEIRAGLKAAGIHRPNFASGFPEIVVSLRPDPDGTYRTDAWDLVRHPDWGLYIVPFWSQSRTLATFRLLDSQDQVIFQQAQEAAVGRNVLTFPQLRENDGQIYRLEMTLEDQTYTVPLRMR